MYKVQYTVSQLRCTCTTASCCLTSSFYYVFACFGCFRASAKDSIPTLII